MTDIVDRLNSSLSAGYSELRKEAAAEIMQLRAKIYDLTINIEYFNKLKTSYEELIGELQEERDALKQAHLNGMGASREAALMAKLEAAEKEVAHIKEVEFPRKALAVVVGWKMKCARLEQERDEVRTELKEVRYGVAAAHDTIKTLHAKIEAMEKQEPVDLNYIELMNSAQKIVESYVYFRRFIASTPLENNIAVWMADFVFAQLGAKGVEK